MVLVAEPLPSVLGWFVDAQQAGIAELLENFLAGKYFLLLPDLPVFVDHLLQHPLRRLLQGLLLAVVEVRTEGRGVEATTDLDLPHRPQQSCGSHPYSGLN